jgi:hypothetical protein
MEASMELACTPAALTPDPSLAHMQAELARIDVSIQQAVRRWQLAGQDPADAFRGLTIREDEADSLLARPLGTNWGASIALPDEEAQALAAAEAEAARQAQYRAAEARRQGQPLRLEQLAAAFDLDQFEIDTFLVCLAPALDLRYERVYAYLQDDVTRRRPSVNLVLDVLGEAGPQRLLRLRYFGDAAPLFKHRLLERGGGDSGASLPLLLSQTLTPDPSVVGWLLGSYFPRPELGGHASLQPPCPAGQAADELLAADAWPRLQPLSQEAVFVFYGPDSTSQQAAGRLCAACTGRALLAVDMEGVIKGGVPPQTAVSLALRDARLVGAMPYLFNWDACLADGTPSVGRLLAEICSYPGLAIIAGQAGWQATGVERQRSLVWLEFPIPAYHRRHALWQHFLQDMGLNSAVDLEALAGQFALPSGRIRDAVASARDSAAQQGRPLQSQDVLAAARAHSNPRLASLARKIVPRYAWSDIVLPEDQRTILSEIITTVCERALVLDEWGVGQKLASSSGVTVLFAGPPGTGKTMAAEIIAAQLELDLYKIDLSTVVSKYIGETEKNLERIFSEAQSSNAILFFDEADAIFGKRSEVKDAHDRYANIEISYLLQRMEGYDGVTILATNLRANLDEAFTRRLQFAVDFPFPDEADRLRIWQTLFPPRVPRAGDLNFGWLARRFKLSGGSIRNIIVSAAYLGAADWGAVTMKHLLHCTRRELQKMGRLVNEADMLIE